MMSTPGHDSDEDTDHSAPTRGKVTHSKKKLSQIRKEEKLKALQENQQVLLENEQIIQENIAVQENNEHILDEFFDSADAKLKQSISAEAKEERIRGVDESGNNELGMQGFLERESNKNYGKIVAAKTDITPITEQVIQKKVERIRKKTLTQNQLQFTVDQFASATASPHLGPYDSSDKNMQQMQSQNEKLQKLLQSMASASEITEEMRADAKSLLAPIGNNQIGYRSGFKSRSPSPMMSTPGHDSDEDTDHSAPTRGKVTHSKKTQKNFETLCVYRPWAPAVQQCCGTRAQSRRRYSRRHS